MALVPNKAIDRVQFYENHALPFSTNAVAIGITALEASDLETKTEAARAAYNAQQLAMQAQKVATESFLNAVEVMSVAGAALIKKIRAKGEATGDPNVYTLAAIPAPPTPAPRPAPGAPSNLKVTLNADGSLALTWKCETFGAAGTVYQLWRRIGPTDEFEYVGGTGKREFVDDTVPAGSSQLTYKMQAVRSSAMGPWETFNVTFGTPGTGVATGTVHPTLKAA